MGRLEAVELRAYWLDEAREFTPWLAQPENLAMLAEALDMDLELQGVEVSVGPYKADIVARDLNTDRRVIIENQLERTNHDHLGKTLTYASGLDARVIVWIAREFCEEHRRALDFLNELAAPDLQCYGLEVQLWRIGTSPPAPMFRAVATPNAYSAAVREEEKDLSETKGLYLEFWSQFREWAKKQGTILSLSKAGPKYWYRISVGRSKFRIALSASAQKARLGCEIYLRGHGAKRAFKLLKQDKARIEVITGPLDWRELPDKQDARIVVYREGVNIADRGCWGEAFQWLKAEAETFHKAFAPRIKALPVSDVGTDDEADDVAD